MHLIMVGLLCADTGERDRQTQRS